MEEKIKSIKEITTKMGPLPKVYDIQISGNDTLVLNGIIVHNSAIEFGHPEIPIKGDQTVKVKSHIRRVFTRGPEGRMAIVIPEHEVTYHNARVIPIKSDGQLLFRVIHKIPERKGTFFLTNAIKEGFRKFPQILRENLKNKFK